jgi:hypothetical protein
MRRTATTPSRHNGARHDEHVDGLRFANGGRHPIEIGRMA